MFGFLKSKNAKSPADNFRGNDRRKPIQPDSLSSGKAFSPTRPAGRSPAFFNRARYSVVAGDEKRLREAFLPETGNEEKALTANERNSLIAFARHLARNSEDMAALAEQFENNVIGVCGGKAFFNFPAEYDAAAKTLLEAFASWAANCEFFSGDSLQFVLSQTLAAKLLTGRAVLLFDDGLINDSGKIVIFDGDTIADLPKPDFDRAYSPDHTQHQGLVKNPFGQDCGAIVSMSQRGKSVFRPVDDKGRPAVFTLFKPDNVSWLGSPFIIYAHRWRVNQTAFPPAAHASLASVYDIGQIIGFEKEATKKNAQTIGTITSKMPDLPPPADNDGDYADEIIDGEQDASAAPPANASDADDYFPALQFDHEKSTGVLFDVLPSDAKLELLDTKHPNVNTTQFLAALQRRVGWANGLGAVYANGKADSSYSASLVEMMLSWPKFEKEQHQLEAHVCDWIVRRWYDWARRKGDIPADIKLPPHWMRCIEWQWPRKPSINPVDEENAFSTGLRNGTSTFKARFGPDWRRIVEQRVRERDAFREAGITYPGDLDNNGIEQRQAVEDEELKEKQTN